MFDFRCLKQEEAGLQCSRSPSVVHSTWQRDQFPKETKVNTLLLDPMSPLEVHQYVILESVVIHCVERD